MALKKIINLLLILSVAVLFSCTSNIPFLDSEPITVITGNIEDISTQSSTSLSGFSVQMTDLVSGKLITDFNCGSTNDDGEFTCQNRSAVKTAYNDILITLQKEESSQKVLLSRYLRQLIPSVSMTIDETFVANAMGFFQDKYTAGVLASAESIDLNQREDIGTLFDSQYYYLKDVVSVNSSLEPQLIVADVTEVNPFLTQAIYAYEQLNSRGLIDAAFVSINNELKTNLQTLAASVTYGNQIRTSWFSSSLNCDNRFRELPFLNGLSSSATIQVNDCISFAMYDGRSLDAHLEIDSRHSLDHVDVVSNNIAQRYVTTNYTLTYPGSLHFSDAEYPSTVSLSGDGISQYIKANNFSDNVHHFFTWLTDQYGAFPQARFLNLEEFSINGNETVTGVKLTYDVGAFEFHNSVFGDDSPRPTVMNTVDSLYIPINEIKALESYHIVNIGESSYAEPLYRTLNYDYTAPTIPVSSVLYMFNQLTRKPYYLEVNDKVFSLMFKKNGTLDILESSKEQQYSWNLTKSVNGEISLSFTLDTHADIRGSVQQLQDFEFELVNQDGGMVIYWFHNEGSYSLRDSIFAYQRFSPSYDEEYRRFNQYNTIITGYEYIRHSRVAFNGKEDVLKITIIKFEEFKINQNIMYIAFDDHAVYFYDKVFQEWVVLIGYPLSERLVNRSLYFNNISFETLQEVNGNTYRDVIKLHNINSHILIDQEFKLKGEISNEEDVDDLSYVGDVDINNFSAFTYSESDISLLASCEDCWINSSGERVENTYFRQGELFVQQEHNLSTGLKRRYYQDINRNLIKWQEEFPVSSTRRGSIITRFLNDQGNTVKTETVWDNGEIQIEEDGVVYTKAKVAYDPLERSYKTSPFIDGDDYIHIHTDRIELFTTSSNIDGFIGDYFVKVNDRFTVPINILAPSVTYTDTVNNRYFEFSVRDLVVTGSLNGFKRIQLKRLILNHNLTNSLRYDFRYTTSETTDFQYAGYTLYDVNDSLVEESGIISIRGTNEEAYIRSLINKPSLPIFNTDFKAIESLDLTGSDIQNIDFLRYFVDLKQLNLTTLSTLNGEISLLSLLNLERIIFDDDYEFINWSGAMLQDFTSRLSNLNYLKANGIEFIDSNIELGASQNPPFSQSINSASE